MIEYSLLCDNDATVSLERYIPYFGYFLCIKNVKNLFFYARNFRIEQTFYHNFTQHLVTS